MIRLFLAAALLLTGTAVLAQELIAHWDFSKGKIESVDGKYKTSLRGSTCISGDKGKQLLDIGINNRNKGEGIIAAKKYPALTPKGAFRLEIKARLREKTSVKSMLMFWDTIYYMDPGNSTPERNRGFNFYLVRAGNDRFLPQAWFGFGKELERASGHWIKLEEYEDFTVALEYDGVKKVSFFLNGKLIAQTSFKKGGGPLAQSNFPLVIGDRYGSGYNRFDGQIHEVKLFALPSKTAK